jgi:hypothetical protein
MSGMATSDKGQIPVEHAEGGMGAPNCGNTAFQQMELVEQQVRSQPRS